jgi:hypothetical protein
LEYQKPLGSISAASSPTTLREPLYLLFIRLGENQIDACFQRVLGIV